MEILAGVRAMFCVNMLAWLLVTTGLVVTTLWDLTSGHQTLTGRCVWAGVCVWLASLLAALLSSLLLSLNILALRASLHHSQYWLLYPWLGAYAALISAILPSGG